MSREPSSEEIEETAARWFWRRDSDAWTEQDQAEFDAWLQGSTAHRIAFLRLEAGWEECTPMRALQNVVPRDSTASSVDETPARRARTWSRPILASAAAALLAIGFGLTRLLSIPADQEVRYSTAVGGQNTVQLSDSSQVTLNTDTTVLVQLSDKARRIVLDKGEAFFVVAKDPARPFVVHAGDKRVIAVGTQFSVRRDNGRVKVVVTEGRVRIEDTAPSAALLRSAPSVTLAAGAVAIAEESRPAVTVQESAAGKPELLLKWREGQVVFDGTPLSEAVDEINRYNRRHIVVADTSIAGIRVGGSFSATDVDAFLWLLQSSLPIQVDQRDEAIVLTRR